MRRVLEPQVQFEKLSILKLEGLIKELSGCKSVRFKIYQGISPLGAKITYDCEGCEKVMVLSIKQIREKCYLNGKN